MNRKRLSLIAALAMTLAACPNAFAKGDNDEGPKVDPAGVYSPVGQLIDVQPNGSTGAATLADGTLATPEGFCTAFFVGDGTFITAGHCLRDKETRFAVQVSNENGATQVRQVDTFMASPPDNFNANDFAVVYVDPELTKDLAPLALDCGYKPKLGDAVSVEGFPEDLGRISVTGQVAAAKETKWSGWSKPLIRMAIPISYGNSGSPVTHDGKVVGIAVGVLPNNRTLSAAQPISAYCKIFKAK